MPNHNNIHDLGLARTRRGLELSLEMEKIVAGEHVTTVMAAIVFLMLNQSKLLRQAMTQLEYATLIDSFMQSLKFAFDEEKKHETLN